MKTSQLLLSTLILGIIIAEPSTANWENGGGGVVNFPNTVGTDKIIFAGQTRENIGTDYASFRDTKDNVVTPSLPTNPLPWVYMVNNHYTTRPEDGIKMVRLNSFGPIIHTQVSKGNIPIACNAGQSNCGSTGTITGTQTCTYTEVALTGPSATFFKVIGIGGSYTKGFATCATNAQLISCPAPTKPAYNTLTYATLEERSRYGTHRMYPIRYIVFTSNHTSYTENYCRNVVGGNYYSTLFDWGGKPVCNIEGAAREKISWDQYARSPIADTVPTGRCRTIKDLN